MKRSRKAAIKARELYYKTGRPCKHGHVSKRITKDGSCYACRMEGQRLERQKIRERFEQVTG